MPGPTKRPGERPPASTEQTQLTFGLPAPARPPPSPPPLVPPPPGLWVEGDPGFDPDDEPFWPERPAPSTGGPTPEVPTTSTATAGRAPAGAPPLPPLPVAPARAEARVFSVGELVRAVRLTLESRFTDVRVEGEITGFKRSGPGHFYFCLKDGEAQVDCVMFSREAGRVKFKPADGQLVRCRGRLTIYEGRGKFQMSVTALEPAGAGLLMLAFEDLKRKLAAEGLFAPERKRPLPFWPRRIGVVSSSSGAVIRDIIRVAHRRAAIPILLAPTPVQGEGAALAIAFALRSVVRARDVDLVILARGGGSLEDLWCFNDEGLARAIASCPVPVISAVGHETDFTIADFVADVRAPTPSAAAELAVPVADELRAELLVLGRRAARAVTAEVARCRLVVERARRRVGDPRRLVDDRRQALDELGARAARALRSLLQQRRTALRGDETRLFRAHPQRRIGDQRKALHLLEHRLVAAMRARLVMRRAQVESMAAKLGSLSPLGVLERGYSLALRPDGHLVTSAAQLLPGQPLVVRFHDGQARTTVDGAEVGPGTDGGPGEGLPE